MSTIFTNLSAIAISAIRRFELRLATFGKSAFERTMWADFTAYATTVAACDPKSVLTQGDVAFGHAQGHQTWRPCTG